MGDPITSSKILLEITSKVDRKKFTFDGKEYELRSLEEMSIVEQFEFKQRVDTLSRGAKTVEEAEKIQDLTRRVFTDLLVAPEGDDIADRLSDDNKWEIVQHFLVQTNQEAEKKRKIREAEKLRKKISDDLLTSQDSPVSSEPASTTGSESQ